MTKQVLAVLAMQQVEAGTLDLDDQILATPAIANGAVYLRSNTKIYKVAK